MDNYILYDLKLFKRFDKIKEELVVFLYTFLLRSSKSNMAIYWKKPTRPQLKMGEWLSLVLFLLLLLLLLLLFLIFVHVPAFQSFRQGCVLFERPRSFDKLFVRGLFREWPFAEKLDHVVTYQDLLKQKSLGHLIKKMSNISIGCVGGKRVQQPLDPTISHRHLSDSLPFPKYCN